MTFTHRTSIATVVLLALVTFTVAGCGREQAKNTESTEHGEWWCTEHGIPEDECLMCLPGKKEEAKKKGDWCEHNFVGSQCFVCNPEVKEKYAKEYRQKYPGKEPPEAYENPKKKK